MGTVLFKLLNYILFNIFVAYKRGSKCCFSFFFLIARIDSLKQILRNIFQIFPFCTLFENYYCKYRGGGGGKSQCANFGLNSSVTECPIEIILSGMTYYHHWFEEFVKSKHIFFQIKVHFLIYLIVWIVGSSQILLNCVWPFKLRLS